ncbi:hypothetical protein LCGC14_0392290 [marine sediment metagenome]|uniref:Uncharacterized protein n=1 Tax=marine sediment metagenome TaxID=412755 RepID=A0A0F9SZE4_9ZZZZ
MKVTFKVDLTDEEVTRAIDQYVRRCVQKEFDDVSDDEITIDKRGKVNKAGVIAISGTIHTSDQEPTTKKKSRFRKSESHYLCGECESRYEDCDCVGGPTCEGCEERYNDCKCK